MKRFAKLLLMWTVAALGCVAQTFTVPQTTTPVEVFNAVITAQTSGCLANQGQNVQFVFYQGTGSTGNPFGVQLRLEGSFNSDLATCTTGTWFPISDDGTDPGPKGTGLILAIQSYPFMRVNLVKCDNCDPTDSITAFYTASSSMPGTPFGLYGAGQQNRKVLFMRQALTTTATSDLIPSTPYGSAGGFILINSNSAFTSGSTITVESRDFANTLNEFAFTLPTSGLTVGIVIPVPAFPATAVDVVYTSGGGSVGQKFSAYYYFYPPGQTQGPPTAQPAKAVNSEATATAATASVTLTPKSFQRAHLFHISARCGAGSAQLLVVDTTTSTNLWSSGSAEVGTSTFQPNPWNPALAGPPGDTIQVQLTTCGGGNLGTLDVQGSVF